MAKGEEAKPADNGKGKGKADDDKKQNGEDAKKDDKKPQEEELSEEDQQLKGELDMLVERLHEPKHELYQPALSHITEIIKTSTSSMTAVPKPLKFLRPHYAALEKRYTEWRHDKSVKSDDARSLANILSVLGMTYADEDRVDTLKYRLAADAGINQKGADRDLGGWGHEYMRHLALETGTVHQRLLNSENVGIDDIKLETLVDLVNAIVPFFLKHNAEADAVDLLSELEQIEQLENYLDENTFERVCLYMISMVPLLTFPDNDTFLRTAHNIYKKYNRLSQAVTLAIRLNDYHLVDEDIDSTKDESLRRQMAFQCARQKVPLYLNEGYDDTLWDCFKNIRLHEHFKNLGKELNILDPKPVQDIYKTHLESSRTAGITNVDSARHNLSSAFVNAFVNAGFGQDTMMLNEDESGQNSKSWVWKTKDDGKISTAASVGLLHLWDVDNGLQASDRYSYSDDDMVRAGACLAVGLVNSGTQENTDSALALLNDPAVLNHKTKEVRVMAIMGLGLAYAGTQKEEVLEILLPYVSDTSLDMQISAMAALALGHVFVGSANADISEAIVTTFFDEERQNQLRDKWTRFMALGLALLYFGRQEEVDDICETLEAVEHPMSKPSSILCQICAWAGTGTVLKLQELLHICNESVSPEEAAAAKAESTSGGESGASEAAADKAKRDAEDAGLLQSYAVLGLSLVAMGEDIGSSMIMRQFGHLMHYGAPHIRRAVPLAMGLISPSHPQMAVYDTLSRYSHDTDNDVAVNAILAMGLLGAGTNNARLAQLLRQLASYYSRDPNSLFMVRIAQALLHMGKGALSLNPYHTDRGVLSRVGAASLLTVLLASVDAKSFILAESHWMLYFLVPAVSPRMLVTLDEDLQPIKVNVRVGQAVDTVGQAGRPKSITGWQTQSTPAVLGFGERAELEDEKYIPLSNVLEGLVILRKNPDWEE